MYAAPIIIEEKLYDLNWRPRDATPAAPDREALAPARAPWPSLFQPARAVLPYRKTGQRDYKYREPDSLLFVAQAHLGRDGRCR